jgi:hypothetical protein
MIGVAAMALMVAALAVLLALNWDDRVGRAFCAGLLAFAAMFAILGSLQVLWEAIQ